MRQLALLHFRNTITLSVKLEEALARAHARVPPAIVQMLLVLQVCARRDPRGGSGRGCGSKCVSAVGTLSGGAWEGGALQRPGLPRRRASAQCPGGSAAVRSEPELSIVGKGLGLYSPSGLSHGASTPMPHSGSDVCGTDGLCPGAGAGCWPPHSLRWE